MYESFYKLDSNPFQLTADPAFFFSSQTHKRGFSYLLYGLKQEEGFIVITGDVGTGKTTLASYLLERITNQDFVIANIVNTNLHAEDLLRLISSELRLRYKDFSKAQLLSNLKLYFQKCVQEGKRVLLLIDEAQNLPAVSLEELRMLSNMQWQGKPLIQCFLLGQNELKKVLRSPHLQQFRQRIIATSSLRPLDLEETGNYIHHRLRVSGWNDDPVLDNDVIEGIYAYSEGIPRKINLLCGRILLYGTVEELHHIDYRAFKQVLNDIQDEYWSDEKVDE